MKSIYWTVVAAMFVALSAVADAAPTISLADPLGDPTSITLNPGQSFSLNVALNSDVQLSGLSYYLQSSIDGKFSVLGETLDGNSPLTDPNFISTFPVLLSSINSPDFGYGKQDASTNAAAGAYPINSLSLLVDATTLPGTYTIFTSTSSGIATTVAPPTLETFTNMASSAVYTVNVVPEPASCVLLASGGLAVALWRRRQRA